MAFEHPTVPGAFDRTPARPNDSAVVWVEGRLLQAAELNEGFGIVRGQAARAGYLSSRDGDRRKDAGIYVNRSAKRIVLEAGEVYAAGDVRPVAAVTLENIDLAGKVVVGVRLIAKRITPEEDATLLGLAPGTEAEGEKGAEREEIRLVWGYAGDGAEGQLYPVYTLIGGTPLDQAPPAELSQTAQTVGLYDFQANGHYIADGCEVTALGLKEGAQYFSISAGIANINGVKRSRIGALSFSAVEGWDTFQIDGEQYDYTVSPHGMQALRLRNGPLDSVVLIQIEKEVTETIVRSAAINGSDNLQNDSLVKIVEVKQGGTTYVKGTDYQRTNDKVDWSLSGGEPAPGSSYTVKYRYRDAVQPVSQSAHEIIVTGGRTGGQVVVTYKRRLPRIDLLCLNELGAAVYVHGGSSRRPVPPMTPGNLLKLAEVHNSFEGVPRIVSNGTRNFTYEHITRMEYLLRQGIDLIALNRLQLDIHAKEPVAKRGMFVDPFVDDRWRDKGVAQNAAVRNGTLSLPVAQTIHELSLSAPVTLPYEIETLFEQEVQTTSKKVNRFSRVTIALAGMTVIPAFDNWTEFEEVWASALTHRVHGPVAQNVTEQQVVGIAERPAEFLRAITLQLKIERFGDGEILDKLVFDGVDMTPEPQPVGAADGTLSVSLDIPAKTHAAGDKLIEAFGAGGSHAFARFVGSGEISSRTLQQVTTTVQLPPPPEVVERVVFRDPPAPRPVPRPSPVPKRPRERDNGDRREARERVRRDPRAQTFSLPFVSRHVAGVWLVITKIGDPQVPCFVELRELNTAGYPTDEVIAQVKVDMSKVPVGQQYNCLFPVMPYWPVTKQCCFAILTDDTNHEIAAAKTGGFDDKNQRFQSVQPYMNGVELESSNNSTWAALHGSDLTFGVLSPLFILDTRRVELGNVDLDRCSEFKIAAAVDVPDTGCSVLFEVKRAGGQLIYLQAGESYAFGDWVTETASVTAILKGTAEASPKLYPGIKFVAGQLAETANYVSRTFKTDNATRFPVRVKRDMPNGSTLKVSLRKADGGFEEALYKTGEVLDENTLVDVTFELEQGLGIETALQLEITGHPGARPVLSDLRATAI